MRFELFGYVFEVRKAVEPQVILKGEAVLNVSMGSDARLIRDALRRKPEASEEIAALCARWNKPVEWFHGLDREVRTKLLVHHLISTAPA